MTGLVWVWQVVGFMFVAVLGTGLHFLFELANRSLAAALVSAVNESIWEHMKLLFYPMTAFSLFQYHHWGKYREDFWPVKLRGTLPGLILIPVLYYSYTGILGVSADWFNITIFFIAAGVTSYTETRLFMQNRTYSSQRIAVLFFILIALLFTFLTFRPPHIPLFRDPITGTYGYFMTE